jgi:molybdopterin biosynthesis enzyme
VPISTGCAPTRGASSCAPAATADGSVELYPNQGSGVLTSAVWGDGLIDNPPQQVIRRGDPVRFLPFSALLG